MFTETRDNMVDLKRIVVWLLLVICLYGEISTANDNCIGRDEFEKRLALLEQDNQALHARLREQSKVSAVMTGPSSTKTNSMRNKHNPMATDSAKRYLLVDESPGVAFSVTVAAASIDNLGANQSVHFDKVVSNYGNHYDINLNAFRAPVSGWYVFSITLMSRPNDTQYLYVVKNGVMAFHVYSQGTSYTTDGRTMVLQLDQGDEVWVQTSESTAYSHYIHGSEHTSFTGFLLYTA